MLFYSWQFFLFLPIVYGLYLLVADRWRWLVVLAGSVVFYAFCGGWHLPVVLLAVVLGTYVAGRCLAARGEGRSVILWGGIGFNLLILIFLKYRPFLAANANVLLGPLGVSLPRGEVLLSIGASYYVFQAISYLRDVSLGTLEAERHLGYFALYLSFFPKLLQGPIERGADLLPQLRAPYRFEYEKVRSGLILFAWGMFQKLVVADRLALFVDPIYGNVRGSSGTALLLATYVYAVQLLCDFGGYTDMALGLGRIFGIELTQNFKAPYAATSVAEFWRRWHISFSRWLLESVFTPLQLAWRDGRNWGTAAALIVTFLVSGVWHGASWGFLVWGALHGVYLTAGLFWRPVQKKLYRRLGLEKSWQQRWLQVFVTFNLVCFAWIFFRAGSVADAWYVVTRIAADLLRLPAEIATQGIAVLGDNRPRLFQSLPGMILVTAVALLQGRVSLRDRPAWFRWGVYYGLVYGMLYFSVLNGKPQFIYFQF